MIGPYAQFYNKKILKYILFKKLRKWGKNGNQ